MKGKYVTVDGDRQTGKTTLIQALAAKALELGHDVVVVNEPSETEISDAIRAVLRQHGDKCSPITQALLYTACRRQILEELVLPALSEGKLVLSERSVISTAAYQGTSLQAGEVELLTELVLPDGLMYDLGFVLAPRSSQESDPARLNSLTRDSDVIVQTSFQSSYVHKRYYRTIYRLNAALSAEAVSAEACEILEHLLAE